MTALHVVLLRRAHTHGDAMPVQASRLPLRHEPLASRTSTSTIIPPSSSDLIHNIDGFLPPSTRRYPCCPAVHHPGLSLSRRHIYIPQCLHTTPPPFVYLVTHPLHAIVLVSLPALQLYNDPATSHASNCSIRPPSHHLLPYLAIPPSSCPL